MKGGDVVAEKMIEAYDTRTGAKLLQRVPEGWLRIYPYLSKTPKTPKVRIAEPVRTSKTTEKE